MTSQGISFRPLSPVAGAEVTGLDLRGEFSEAVSERLRDAWRTYSLLLFRSQEIDEDEQRRVGRVFGAISDESYSQARLTNGMNYISNVVDEAAGRHGPLGFHTENSFYKDPLRGLMLYGVETPPEGAGGDTLFCNLQLVYRSLPETLRKRIQGLEIRHGYPDVNKDQAIPGMLKDPNAPSYTRPLIFTHPETGEPLLFLSRRHADCIVGVSAEESAELIEELSTYVGRPENTYQHVWRPLDLVVWDNLTLQHGRTDFDRKYRRHLRRLQLA